MNAADTPTAVESPAAHTAPSGQQRERLTIVLGLLAAALLSAALYWRTTSIGFLLDDFFHLEYLYQSFHGQPQALFSRVVGGWSYTTDGLACYRPGTSLSLAFDYLCWGTNAFGYHLSNLLQLAANTVLVGLITSQLCSRYMVRHRAFASVTAALLFACYPLHAESASWIIGRVDLLCTMFYLGSLYGFLRADGAMVRTSAAPAPNQPVGAAPAPNQPVGAAPAHNQPVGAAPAPPYTWQALSLASFLAALTCKEMGVTLPAVLTIAALLLARGTASEGGAGAAPTTGESLLTAVKGAAPTTGQSLLTAVKGAAPTTGQSLLTAIKCAAPTTGQWLLRALKVTAPYWLLLTAFAIWRTHAIGTIIGGYGAINKRAILQGLQNFMDGATWFKVMHGVTDEYPSPTWLRFASESGIAVATAAGLAVMLRTRRFISLYAFLGAWLLVALLPTFQIFHVFPNLLGSRLFFLSSAPLCMLIALALAEMPTALTSKPQLHRTLVATSALTALMFVVTWSVLLSVNLQPWLEAGQRMANLRRQALDILESSAADDQILFANLPADYKGAGLIGRPEYFSVMCKPPFAPRDFTARILTCESILPGTHDYVAPERLNKKIQQATSTFVYSDMDGKFFPLKRNVGVGEWSTKLVSAVQQQDVIWLSQAALNPLQAQAVCIEFDRPADQLGHVQLVWRSESQEWWRCVADPVFIKGRTAVFIPGRLRTWTFALPIQQFGIRLSAPASVTYLSVCREVKFEPQLDVENNRVYFDASLMPGAAKARVFVSKPSAQFPDVATIYMPDPKTVEWSADCVGNRGELTVPNQFTSAGLREVCAIALDKHNRAMGVLTEPLEIRVDHKCSSL